MTDQQSVAPTTTAQEDMVTAGQRHINVMWERTQQIIAVMVTVVTSVVCVYEIRFGSPQIQALAFALLSNAFFLIVGTYFQRTNHTKVGGVGVKPATEDEGR